MHTQLVGQKQQRIAETKYLPSVSIILPFQPTTTLKTKLQYSLKLVTEEIEEQLLKQYTTEKAVPILIKLRNLLRNLNYNTHKKSIALFVSPVVEKVYYLEIEEDKKKVIDEPFEIRDLVNSKKEIKKYLVMLMNSHSSQMYYSSGPELALIKYNVLINTKSYKKTYAGKDLQNSNYLANKEIPLHEFLIQMDQGLSMILKSYPVPVFAIGPQRILEKFKCISKHSKKIVQFIEGNFEEIILSKITETINFYTDQWPEIKKRHLMNQIEIAEEANDLITGLDKVWFATKQNKEMLLIVEEDYSRSTEEWIRQDSLFRMDSLYEKAFYLKDEVEEIIERVLENGGDVEFAEKGILEKYQHIVLLPIA